MQAKSRQRLIFAGLALVFGLLYASYNIAAGGLFQSPDEQAVAVFAGHFAQNHTLRLERPLASDLVLPRSVTISQGYDVPGGFIALPLLYGHLWRWLGERGLYIVVAVLVACGPLGAHALFARYFGESVAWRASIMAWLYAPFVYYGARSFLPNALFTSLLLIAAGLIVSFRRKSWLGLPAGLALGLAIAIRPVEAVWVLPAVLLLVWQERQFWRASILAAFSSLAPILWTLYWQAKTYGAWWSTGYAPIVDPAAGAQSAVTWFSSLTSLVFPFGAHPWQALLVFLRNEVVVYWWVVVPLFVGLVAVVKLASKNIEYKKYSIVFLLICAYLILYYGSWAISDHPDPNWTGLGVAYNRYWLPMTMLSLPFVIIGLDVLAAHWRSGRGANYLFALVVVGSLSMSLLLRTDNLWAMYRNGVEYQGERDKLVAVLPTTAVIITAREDKWLWPRFAVIRQGEGETDYVSRLGEVFAQTDQIYWLTALPDSHVRDLEQRVFRSFGYEVASVPYEGAMRLYKVTISHD